MSQRLFPIETPDGPTGRYRLHLWTEEHRGESSAPAKVAIVPRTYASPVAAGRHVQAVQQLAKVGEVLWGARIADADATGLAYFLQVMQHEIQDHMCLVVIPDDETLRELYQLTLQQPDVAQAWQQLREHAVVALPTAVRLPMYADVVDGSVLAPHLSAVSAEELLGTASEPGFSEDGIQATVGFEMAAAFEHYLEKEKSKVGREIVKLEEFLDSEAMAAIQRAFPDHDIDPRRVVAPLYGRGDRITGYAYADAPRVEFARAAVIKHEMDPKSHTTRAAQLMTGNGDEITIEYVGREIDLFDDVPAVVNDIAALDLDAEQTLWSVDLPSAAATTRLRKAIGRNATLHFGEEVTKFDSEPDPEFQPPVGGSWMPPGKRLAAAVRRRAHQRMS